MRAHALAAPVAERLDGPALVLGAGRSAVYLDLGGFVAVAAPELVLPNGLAVARPGAPPAGARVRVEAAGARVWDPALRLPPDPAAHGRAVLEALGGAARGRAALGAAESAAPEGALAAAVAARDPAAAGAAAARLLGRGPGLTPEGDDVVAATAAVVAAGPWPAAQRQAWLAAAVPADLRARTTALSATLLELAAAGQVAEPLQALFGPDWRSALARLVRLGHTTGRAYAAAAAHAATRLPPP